MRSTYSCLKHCIWMLTKLSPWRFYSWFKPARWGFLILHKCRNLAHYVKFTHWYRQFVWTTFSNKWNQLHFLRMKSTSIAYVSDAKNYCFRVRNLWNNWAADLSARLAYFITIYHFWNDMLEFNFPCGRLDTQYMYIRMQRFVVFFKCVFV